MSYIFYLPNYVPYSNGIKSLWYTALLFSKHRDTIIIAFHGGEVGVHEVPAAFESLINRDRVPRANDIVIYPDMIQGNPLHGEKIARYLMAKPYILNGQGINRGASDFLFAYSRAVDRNLPQLTTLLPDLQDLAKYKKTSKEKTVVVYYGKCRISLGETKIKEIIKNFDRVKVITRSIPQNKDVLYEQIASASLFVSYDPLSSLAYEANLVGTPSLLLDPIFREDFDEFNHKLPGFYYSYDDLIDQDLWALGEEIFEKSHADLITVLEMSDSQAKSMISQMESWFQSGGGGGGGDPLQESIAKMMSMPGDFAKATGQQFLSDIGVKGNGLIGNAITEGIKYVFNIGSVDDAMSLMNRQNSISAMSMVGSR